jgi:uncharacterized protein
MLKGSLTIFLLIVSNVFMTLAWYGHLQFGKISWLKATGLFGIILISWCIAFFEYLFQVPANKLGYLQNGGPFSIFELKTIQEAVSLGVFVVINIVVFKETQFQWNHAVGLLLMVLAVYIIFKKW